MTGPIPLGFDHVSGAFTLLGIGCLCSLLIFCMEFVWYHSKNTKTRNKDLKFLVVPLAKSTVELEAESNHTF